MQTKSETSILKKSIPFFTVVIPTLNEEKNISNLLKDLTQQTFKDFSVIHVDGSSEDKTVTESKKFKNKLDLKIKIVKKRNVSFQRNAGGNLAKSKWIIFMDSDNRLPKYFLQGIKYKINKHEVVNKIDLFTTWVTVDKYKTIDKSAEKLINFGLELYAALGRESALGALIGVRKKIFEKINFDEKQKIFEEGKFVQEIINSGHAYHLFKEPRYNFSLRRMKTEGPIKMIGVVVSASIYFLLGKEFDKKDFGYVMEGGEYYKNVKKNPFTDIQSFLKNATKDQLHKARKIWRSLKDF